MTRGVQAEDDIEAMSHAWTEHSRNRSIGPLRVSQLAI